MKSTIKKTYIPVLDDLLNGGTPSGASLIFCSMPGIISDVFGLQLLAERSINDKEVGFIYTNTRTPSEIAQEFDRYGWSIQTLLDIGQIFFVDSVSPTIGIKGQGKYNVDALDQTQEIVGEAIKDAANGTGIIDNLATLIDSLGEEKTIMFIEYWNSLAKANSVNLVYLFTNWGYSNEILNKIMASVNCVIHLRAIEEKIIYRQVFTVIKSDWADRSGSKIFYEVVCPGGIKVFIPKILVTGPYNAGKTSFVHALSTVAVSVDRQAFELFPTTVGLDIGHIDYKGFSADIFGTPGQERFDLLLELLAREALGAFIVIDSTKPETFARAKDMIKICKIEMIPRVVVANKQDLENALSSEEIRRAMNLPDDVPIVLASSKNREGIFEAMETLLKLIYR
ncbi:MAG: ATPase domain-containing protein [Halobacteria archaeon]